MDIKKIQNSDELIFIFEGRLDSKSSPMLITEIKKITKDITSLIFDFKNLEYISVSGLRAILMAYRLMNGKGNFVIKNSGANVKEIFKLTKLCNILPLE